MIKNPGVIQTGSEVADSVITVLLSTTILVGGVIGCLLDNIIPGKKCDNLKNQKYIQNTTFLLEKYVVNQI